jgi:hypothetical protein
MEAQEKQSRFNGQRPDPEGRCTSILYGFHLGKPNAATDVSGESVREDIEKLIRDLKYTVRSLRRSKIFAAAVAVRLSACIAVNVAIFAIVNSVLLRPLPVPNSEEIVLMSNRYPKAGVGEQASAARATIMIGAKRSLPWTNKRSSASSTRRLRSMVQRSG